MYAAYVYVYLYCSVCVCVCGKGYGVIALGRLITAVRPGVGWGRQCLRNACGACDVMQCSELFVWSVSIAGKPDMIGMCLISTVCVQYF